MLVYFDAKQLEMRVAAYASGDQSMIKACESTDLHAANAAVIFGEAFTKCTDPNQRAALRTLAKTSGFAVCYLAEAQTVYARLIAAGQLVQLRQVEAMLRKMRRGFNDYYRWQDKRLMACVKHGWTDSPLLGRRRWLGHDPSPTECANFPIQGGAADIMNDRIPIIAAAAKDVTPQARLVAQVHDSVCIEVPSRHAIRIGERAREIFEAPITFASSGRELTASFPVDLEIIERWH